MASLATIATVATVGSALVGAGTAIYSGYLQKQAADTTAHTLENQGKADFASAQRDALQKQLETKYLLSTQQAQAAASGAGAGSDAPTIVRMMTETAKRGELASENVMYTGDLYKHNFGASAAAAREGGDASFLGGFLGGAGRLISGAGDFARGKQAGIMAIPSLSAAGG